MAWVPAVEPDNTKTPFNLLPVPFCEADTTVRPAIVAPLIAVTKLATAEAVACAATFFASLIPILTNLCVVEFSKPADEDTKTNETSPIFFTIY